MLVILEAASGPIVGRRIEIHAGTMLRIGRTGKADYAVGEDAYLSSLHFSVECDGMQCRIRDMASSNGTFVNGDRITLYVAKEGDTISAGGTTFVVHIERSGPAAAPAAPAEMTQTAKFARTPPPADPPEPPREAGPPWTGFSRPQAILLSALYRDGETVYALLDAIRDSRIPAFLDASGEQYQRVDETNPASPFLVEVPPRSKLLDVLIKDGWNHGWGFYFTAAIGFENALWHWRSFVTLRNENGQAVTFRFWDPRVIRAVAPAMTPSEAAGFFGLISRFIVEGDKPELAAEFSLGPRGVSLQSLVLV